MSSDALHQRLDVEVEFSENIVAVTKNRQSRSSATSSRLHFFTESSLKSKNNPLDLLISPINHAVPTTNT